MPTLKLEGVADLKKALEKKAAEYRAEIEQAVAEGAEEVADDWKAHVAVEDGDYRDSIGVKQDGTIAEIANFARKGRHGIFPEFGTSKQKAQPSAFPAAERERNKFPDRLRKALK